MICVGPCLLAVLRVNVRSTILVLVLFTCMPGSLSAQYSDDAHSTPRPNVAADSNAPVRSDLRLRTQPLRVNVDLVLVPVSVTDSFNRPVLGLSKDNFELFDGGREQQIRLFSSEDSPLSVALILDVSTSMADKISIEGETVAEFARNTNPADEYIGIAV